MSENTKKLPQIRFVGFTDAWERRKAKELFNPLVKKGCDELPVLSVTQEFGVVYRDEVGIDIKYDRSTLNNYKVIHPGDFVISLRSFQGGFELSDKLGITSPAYTIFKPIETKEQDSLFWKTQFKTYKFIESLKTVTFGIRDGKSISFSEFGDLALYFPSSIGEQIKIGKLFKQLDDTITLHNRKLKILSEMKKRLLRQMFPKEGANVPEIRIAGFTDAWEQRRLGEYIIPFSEVTNENNQYPILTSSRKGLFLQTDYYVGHQIASADNTGYNIVPRNFFTYRHMSDDETFKFNINKIVDFGIVSTLYPVFTTNSDLDSEYLQYQLNEGFEFQKYARLQKQGGSRTYMYLSKLKELNLTLPKTIEEQESISEFFTMLDHFITLQQRKINSLKNMKKSLLQQMFV